MQTAPSHVPAPAPSIESCKHLLALSLCLAKLAQSTEVAWRMITNHLRSPPGPQFAPLALSLAGIVANVHAAALRLLRGSAEPAADAAAGEEAGAPPKETKEDGVMALFELFRHFAPRPVVASATCGSRAGTQTLDLAAALKDRKPYPFERQQASHLPLKLCFQADASKKAPSAKEAHALAARFKQPTSEKRDVVAKETSKPAREPAVGPAWAGMNEEEDLGMAFVDAEEDFGAPV